MPFGCALVAASIRCERDRAVAVRLCSCASRRAITGRGSGCGTGARSLVFFHRGCLLATADAVRCRIRSGDEVSWGMHLLFGLDGWSVVIWVILMVTIGLPVAICVGFFGIIGTG